jgi:hypothetical protein
MADELMDAGVADTGTPDAGTTDTPIDAGITQPVDTPDPIAATAPDYESLFADPVADPAAVPDPNAASEIPAEFQAVFGISEYVKDAQQLTGAVTLADEVLKVQNGQAPITGLLENFRAQNGPAFEKAFFDSLVPYIEALSGKKLLDPNAAQTNEPKSPEQTRIDALEAQFSQRQQAEQQQIVQQQTRQANQVLTQTAEAALKGTWLEGKAADYVPQLAAHMGMSEQEAVKQLLGGNTAIVGKAVKAMMAQKEVEGRAYAKFKIAESKTLKSGLPASQGNPRTGEKDPAKMSRAEQIAYLQGQ